MDMVVRDGTGKCPPWLLTVALMAGCAVPRQLTSKRLDPLDGLSPSVRAVLTTPESAPGKSVPERPAQQQRLAENAATQSTAPVSSQRSALQLIAGEEGAAAAAAPALLETKPEQAPELPPAPGSELDEPFDLGQPLLLDEVIESVYRSYPLLEGALYERNIAAGAQIAAQGSFDLKLKGSTENGPMGFYQTYRHAVGFEQPTWNGGDVFAGYRVGRGTFQPWYLERQTNDGGEFKVGTTIPLLRNREIDSRRAEIFRSDLGRQLAEPDIQAQLIGFVQEGSYAYWEWVAASRKYEIAELILELAEERTGRIRRQVEEQFLDPPELTDNLRLVAERKAKLAEADNKRRQTAVKLSLYLRDAAGQPVIPGPELRPEFPEPTPIEMEILPADIGVAYRNRPELLFLDLKRRQLDVDLSEANNDFLPNLDAQIVGSQDVGQPTSSKRDKSPFELEAGLFADVPLQRRKAQGKVTAIQGKLAQLNAKRRITEDKIAVEVRNAYIALQTAYERVLETRRAVEFAEDLARRERRNAEEGLSDMLKVAIREQYAVESADKEVEALLLYYQAQADYRAALAIDRLW